MNHRISGAIALLLVFVAPCAHGQNYTITDLGSLSPTGINMWGQVVGNLNEHAYMWTKFGGLRNLGLLPGGTFSNAAAINDLGVVTGTADGAGVVIAKYGMPGYGDPTVPNVDCSYLVQPFVWKRQIQGLGTVGAATDTYFTPSDWCSAPFYGTAINNLGQIVGYTARLPNEFQWGFFWKSDGGMSLFGSSWPPTFATGISNTGQIVGENASLWGLTGHAESWKNGVETDLGTLAGLLDIYSSTANAVNDLGQVVGWSDTIDFCHVHAVIWNRDGAISDLGTLPGDTESSATKINNFGTVIGSSGNTVDFGSDDFSAPEPLAVVGRPFVWSQKGGMRDLNRLIRANSGWVLVSATDINIWGQIVGVGTRNGQPHGYLLTPKALFRF